MAYTYAELLKAYEALGVSAGRTVYVTSDLGRLMDYEVREKQAVMEAHHRALASLIGDTGTIVVPTASTNLCNTEIVFDPNRTPSYQVGSFSEYVRQLPDARRSFHPFVSYAAIGPNTGRIVENVSRHAFGPETPEARMIELDALGVSIGKHPRFTCSTVHHVEMAMGVPYRYAKEYAHPVWRDGIVGREEFYQYVWYRDIGLNRDGNRRLFQHLSKVLDLRELELGRGRVYSYPLAEFYRQATKLFAGDIYLWCETPPTIRPYAR
jgi:aminoglycoside 3-N-acetyltransferase